jgi:hypothetical protein
MSEVKRIRGKAAHKLVKSIEQQYHDIYRVAAEQCLPHAEILKRLEAAHERRAGLPQYSVEFLYGVSSTLYRIHQQHLEFSYVVDGVRRFLSDPVYRAFDPRNVDTSTGYFAYKSNVTKTF